MSWRWTHNRLLLTKLRLLKNLKKTLVPYGVMRNLDAIIRVSNYVSLNPGLQRARSLWSGASDNLIMLVFPAVAEGSSSSCTPRERAVSLLRVVQNLLEESNEIQMSQIMDLQCSKE